MKKLKSEEGSATIEFIGIVPLAIILLAIMIQFIVSVNGVIVAQSAANEYAKVYSVTENHDQATSAAQEVLNSTGSYLSGSISGPNQINKEFSTTVNAQIKLIFLPDEILGHGVPTINFSTKANSRVIE
ncbi:TadE family protein [Piscibacillus halophilus]|uniref:TadE-like protein n=1 Tax=Piscibacillus halophilus TaxID=571933 RepID=A0A1H9C9X0_9BACI|nr:TadE family protein [Piscibacillus halophilus]SEP97976.1 TadE-like protein [Piscibacillus halophilus]